MNLIVSKTELIEFQKLKLISKLVLIKEKINLFESKYRLKFLDFEATFESKEENFDHWDDYIAWKAYVHSEKALNKQIEDLANVKHIKIVENE